MDMTPLAAAYHVLLDTARADEEAGPRADPPTGEWDVEEVLAHVSLITAVTIAAVADVAAGANTIYDNRIALDRWTIRRVVASAGSVAALRERIHRQGRALCALTSASGEAELDTPVPTLLLSNDTALVDQILPLRDLIDGIAEGELPGHTEQLRALSGSGAAGSVDNGRQPRPWEPKTQMPR